jgi:hypothetical protein
MTHHSPKNSERGLEIDRANAILVKKINDIHRKGSSERSKKAVNITSASLTQRQKEVTHCFEALIAYSSILYDKGKTNSRRK